MKNPKQKSHSAAAKSHSAVAKRALEEAQARREAAKADQREPELQGRKGPEPTRFGDWEKNGIASDF